MDRTTDGASGGCAMNQRVDRSLSPEARELHRALTLFEAFGPDRARPQTTLAAAANLTVRRVQEDLALELLAAGVPVASTCRQPPGMFIARTAAELQPYLNQLKSRCIGLFKRRRLVRNCHRALLVAEADRRRPPAEPDGQFLLCLTEADL